MSAEDTEIFFYFLKKVGLSDVADSLRRGRWHEKHKVRLEVGSGQFGAESGVGIPGRYS